ncbi:MAG: hypothetical protein SNJ72_00630 [Fimbriimonadales bacterium]
MKSKQDTTDRTKRLIASIVLGMLVTHLCAGALDWLYFTVRSALVQRYIIDGYINRKGVEWLMYGALDSVIEDTIDDIIKFFQWGFFPSLVSLFFWARLLFGGLWGVLVVNTALRADFATRLWMLVSCLVFHLPGIFAVRHNLHTPIQVEVILVNIIGCLVAGELIVRYHQVWVAKLLTQLR